MKMFEFHLRVSPEQFLDYYRGSVKEVVIRCSSGVTVQFPAVLLRPFVTAEGIHGDFVLTCKDDHKGAELRRATAMTPE